MIRCGVDNGFWFEEFYHYIQNFRSDFCHCRVQIINGYNHWLHIIQIHSYNYSVLNLKQLNIINNIHIYVCIFKKKKLFSLVEQKELFLAVPTR